jgi:hypothetical protein
MTSQSLKENCSLINEEIDLNFSKIEDRVTNSKFNLEKVLEVYDGYQKSLDEYTQFEKKVKEATENDDKAPSFDFDPNPIVLNPNEINRFLQMYDDFEGSVFHWAMISEYLKKLVRKSYCAGNNDFYFESDKIKSFPDFLSYLSGAKINPFNICIKGDIGNLAFFNTYHVNLLIKGNVGNDFGSCSSNINAKIKGNVGKKACEASENAIIYVKGDVSYNFGKNSMDLITIIDGNVKESFGYSSRRLFAEITGDADGCFAQYSKSLKAKVLGNIDDYGFFECSRSSELKLTNMDQIFQVKKDLKRSGSIPIWQFNNRLNKLIFVYDSGFENKIVGFRYNASYYRRV